MLSLTSTYKNISIAIIGCFVFVFFNAFYISHYIDVNINIDNVIKSVIIIDIAFIIFLLSSYKYKNVLNPLAIYSTFIFFYGYSYLPISADQNRSYFWLSELIAFLSIFSFLIGGYFHSNYPKRFKTSKFSPNLLKGIFTTTILLGIFFFILEIKNIGYIPILNLSSGLNVYAELGENLIHFGHYLVLFMALMPAIAFTNWKLKKINKISLLVISLLSFFIIINFLSRQSILLLIISLFFSYIYFNKVSNRKIFLLGAAVIAMFFFVGNLRLDSFNVESVNAYLKSYAKIDKNVNILETYFTLYSSKNFTTFDNLVLKIYNNNHITLGIYTFKPLISFLLLDRVGIVNYDQAYDGFSSLATYMIEPFLDFNLLGVILANFILGFWAMNTYKSFILKKNTTSIINFSLIVYCILMSPFTNFYFNFFIWFSFLLNTILLNNKASQDEGILVHNNV